MEIDLSGARILYQNDWFMLSEAVVNTWIVMAVITAVCIFLTRGLKVHATTRRQIVAEWIVTKVNGLVSTNMGPKFRLSIYAPLAASVLGISTLSSLLGLVTMFSPTADLSTLIGWAAVVFVLITYWKIKTNGLGGYLLGYFKPLPPLMPINVISEVMTPLSMAFRHFGNVASGSLISMLVYSALGAASAALFGLIPGVVGQVMSGVPLLQIGLPAILSIYFDLFSSCIQAFIFCMLMMINISVAAEG